MVWVPRARAYGFELRLNESVMRKFMNSPQMRKILSEQAEKVRSGVESFVRTAVPAGQEKHADNYVASLFTEDAWSNEYGYSFEGPYSLGDRIISVVGVRPGRGVNRDAKPPLMVEAETHALTSQFGFTVSGRGEDIR